MILKLKNIQLSFTDSRGETFNLLNGVNLDVRRETVTALVGGNGTGKTTLFNVISGFTDDFKGEILFDNLNLKGMAPHKISRLGIGRLFQGRQLIDNLSLMENMKIASVNRDGENPLTAFFRQGQHRRTERQKEEQAIEILEQIFGKDNKYLAMLDNKASELSYGTAAHCHSPPIDGEQQVAVIGRTHFRGQSCLYRDNQRNYPQDGDGKWPDSLDDRTQHALCPGYCRLLRLP